MKTENVPLASLRQHPDYIRGQHSKTYVAELVTALVDAGSYCFPPVLLQPIPSTDPEYLKGAHYWIVDGTHRVAACFETGKFESIPAQISVPLTSLDAIALQVQTNNAHGLRLSVAAQTNAIMKLKEKGMPQKLIAEKTGLNPSSITRILKGTQRGPDNPEGTRGGATGNRPAAKKSKPFNIVDWMKGLARTLKSWEKYGSKIRKGDFPLEYAKALDTLTEMLHKEE